MKNDLPKHYRGNEVFTAMGLKGTDFSEENDEFISCLHGTVGTADAEGAIAFQASLTSEARVIANISHVSELAQAVLEYEVLRKKGKVVESDLLNGLKREQKPNEIVRSSVLNNTVILLLLTKYHVPENLFTPMIVIMGLFIRYGDNDSHINGSIAGYLKYFDAEKQTFLLEVATKIIDFDYPRILKAHTKN